MLNTMMKQSISELMPKLAIAETELLKDIKRFSDQINVNNETFKYTRHDLNLFNTLSEAFEHIQDWKEYVEEDVTGTDLIEVIATVTEASTENATTTVAEVINEKRELKITLEEAMDWVGKIKLPDGEYGAHWTIEQTTDIAAKCGIKLEQFNALEWYLALNMTYSDHYKTVTEIHPNNIAKQVELYAQLSKDFLIDDDSQYTASEKIYLQYTALIK